MVQVLDEVDHVAVLIVQEHFRSLEAIKLQLMFVWKIQGVMIHYGKDPLVSLQGFS
jgi:hypothetical protein